RPGRRARHAAGVLRAGHVPRRRRRGDRARDGDGPLPAGPGAAPVVHLAGRRPDERPPPRRAHGVSPSRARRAAAHARRVDGDRTASLSEPAVGPAVRAVAVGRPPSEGARVPVGAAARARSGRSRRARRRPEEAGRAIGHEEAAMSEPLYFKQLEVGPMQNYVYLFGDPESREAAVVDAAWDIDTIMKVANEDGYRITKNLV